MAEYTKAVVDGRPNFHISLVMDVSPNCDCHGENDVPILPNIGMFASFDPLALDQACADACLAASPMPDSQLARNMEQPDFVDHHDDFRNSTPESEWQSCLSHAETVSYTHLAGIFQGFLLHTVLAHASHRRSPGSVCRIQHKQTGYQ